MTLRIASAILLLAGACFPQASSSIALSNGLELRITADFGSPTGEEKLTVEMHRASGDSFYRIFRDQNNLAVFAYEVGVSRNAGGDAVTVTARPATNDFAARFPNADAGKPVPTLSSENTSDPLRSGGQVELGLFEIPGMGLQVREIFRMKMSSDGASAGGGPLRLAGLRVSVNRSPIRAAGPRGAVSGRYAMFYIPGRGAYFLSTDQPAGRPFLKAGTIDGNRMQFTIDNENFECISDAPILRGVEGGEVWVYHDANYKPAGNWTSDLRSTADEFFMSASDSLGWWE